ncbi:hypothetical protein [Nonomuraea sp. NPDC046570]|uniref:hypothetical protein n=1 Tax=Nonomuraea sp. NPDC046570 TaxID=3155255 RepID=UPI0033D6705D
MREQVRMQAGELHDTVPRRVYGIFALTDESYSLLAGRDPASLTGRRVHLIQLLSHGYWVVGGTVGALASTAMPQGINGIDFALTALFVVLAFEHARKRTNLNAVVNGTVASALAFVVGRQQFLSVAMGTFLLLTIVTYLAWIHRVEFGVTAVK